MWIFRGTLKSEFSLLVWPNACNFEQTGIVYTLVLPISAQFVQTVVRQLYITLTGAVPPGKSGRSDAKVSRNLSDFSDFFPE